MSEVLLEVSDLHVAYGQVEAVRGVSLAVPSGKIATVIGPNGAGKTTLLSAVMGLLPASGRVRFAGENITGRDTEALVRMGMSLVPEKRELFADMTVLENLELGGFSRRRAGESRAALSNTMEEVFALFPRLKERLPQLAGTLSGGERQMLAVGRALIGKPRLLLLDEPSLGLAPLITRDILATISRLRATGLSVLLVEQNARAALQTADYGYVLETGELSLEGPADDLLHDERVIATYLGKR
ncbi:MAG: ABC transporter ATP-binding protein [Burkholderiales bacterium]|nr:ABC transporter ATP-binding protein [Burkholderiales bacterium]